MQRAMEVRMMVQVLEYVTQYSVDPQVAIIDLGRALPRQAKHMLLELGSEPMRLLISWDP